MASWILSFLVSWLLGLLAFWCLSLFIFYLLASVFLALCCFSFMVYCFMVEWPKSNFGFLSSSLRGSSGLAGLGSAELSRHGPGEFESGARGRPCLIRRYVGALCKASTARARRSLNKTNEHCTQHNITTIEIREFVQKPTRKESNTQTTNTSKCS